VWGREPYFTLHTIPFLLPPNLNLIAELSVISSLNKFVIFTCQLPIANVKINLSALLASVSVYLTKSSYYCVNAFALLSNLSVSFSTKTVCLVNLSVSCANTSA
jgi:hypothetical protein